MRVVPPNQVELFYLRLLLCHIAGATSYQCLRTVNNHVYPTFHDAAIALGVAENDNEWHMCLEEVKLQITYWICWKLLKIKNKSNFRRSSSKMVISCAFCSQLLWNSVFHKAAVICGKNLGLLDFVTLVRFLPAILNIYIN